MASADQVGLSTTESYSYRSDDHRIVEQSASQRDNIVYRPPPKSRAVAVVLDMAARQSSLCAGPPRDDHGFHLPNIPLVLSLGNTRLQVFKARVKMPSIQFFERHPIGSKADLAPSLPLFAGGRCSDAVLFGRQTHLPRHRVWQGVHVEGLINWFRDRCSEARLPHSSGHDLRKTRSSLAAENGATERQSLAMMAGVPRRRPSTTPTRPYRSAPPGASCN